MLRLRGANTYAGGTTVTDGGVRVSSSSALGSGAVTLDGGGFEVVVGSGDFTIANNFKIGTGGAGIGNGGTTLTLTGVISDRVPGTGSELSCRRWHRHSQRDGFFGDQHL